MAHRSQLLGWKCLMNNTPIEGKFSAIELIKVKSNGENQMVAVRILLDLISGKFLSTVPKKVSHKFLINPKII